MTPRAAGRRTNKEFQYYPFVSDSSRRGLGIEIESRYYQWANPLAEDIIFLIYKVTNKSDKDLEDVTFGMRTPNVVESCAGFFFL